MIKVKGLWKQFEDFSALKGVDMHVPKGAIYGLVGPNGAGKTTLIRHITGVYRPDAGTVEVDGEPVYENPDVKSRMSYIPDELFYFQQANLLEMKRFYAGIYPNFNEKMFEKLREIFPNIDVKRNIRKLSKGMQKQAALWIALCTNPELLVLDEPVDGLDPVMRKQLWSLVLSEVSARQTTVLISSHNLRELEDVCDYVGIMNHGKVAVERSLCELQENVSKIQLAFEQGMPVLPEHFQILHMSSIGRVYTIIVKGNAKQARAELEKLNPLFIDVLPLTLEEIFIYEIGGAEYAVKDIIF